MNKKIYIIAFALLILLFVNGIAYFALRTFPLRSNITDTICQQFSYQFPNDFINDDSISIVKNYQDTNLESIVNIVISFDTVKYDRTIPNTEREEAEPSPYYNWQVLLLSIFWLGDGDVQPIAYEQAYAPYSGILNLTYNELQDIDYDTFSVARLCSMRELIFGRDSKRLRQENFEDLLSDYPPDFQDKSALEGAIEKAATGDTSISDSLLLDTEDVTNPFQSFSFPNFHRDLYDELDPLLEEFDLIIQEATESNKTLDELYEHYTW